jgi:hypothetical protein
MADYKNIVSFIKKAEGGLSSATTDTASRNPSPCGNGKNGKPYHTNKGIQWITFKGLASQGKYTASCSNFLKMPDDVWYKVYKTGFWDKIQGDRIKNQAIANSFVEMTWGSGLGCSDFSKCKSGTIPFLNQFFKKYYNENLSSVSQYVDFVNELDKKGQSSELFENLNEFRANKYVALNQPKNLKGWLSRLNGFYVLNKPYALSTTEKKNITKGLGGVIAIILVTYLYKQYGNSK